MKDNIEEFIRSNRESFDEESPRPQVWNSIDRKLKGGKQRNSQWIWQAAAVIFFATTSFLLLDRLQPGANQNETESDFSQVEDFYFREINQKRALILDMSETGVSAEAELQKLDAMYLVLKDQFMEKPSQEVIEALTLNLIVRLDLLNQVVADLEEDEKESAADAIKSQAEI